MPTSWIAVDKIELIISWQKKRLLKMRKKYYIEMRTFSDSSQLAKSAVITSIGLLENNGRHPPCMSCRDLISSQTFCRQQSQTHVFKLSGYFCSWGRLIRWLITVGTPNKWPAPKCWVTLMYSQAYNDVVSTLNQRWYNVVRPPCKIVSRAWWWVWEMLLWAWRPLKRETIVSSAAATFK